MITRERSPCGIGTVHARRKTDDQQMRIHSTEGRDRARVIFGMVLMNSVEKFGEALATSAIKIEG